MREEQAHEFYKDPEHLATAGSGKRRQRPMKTGLIPVRFTPEMIAVVKRFASQDGMTVSTWIRRLVGREIQRRQPSATAPMTKAPDVQLDYPPSLQPRSKTVSGVDSERLAAIC